MTMTISREFYTSSPTAPSSPIRSAIGLLNAVPLSVVQLTARLAVARVFWQSAQTKLASWPVTEQLFAYEYNLPLIDPSLAAWLATATELAGALMLALGFASRLGALMLLGVTATIQIFVFPGSWPDHLLWAALLLLVVVRGPGAISLDAIVGQVARRWGL
jgi:putative oxidoreductase